MESKSLLAIEVDRARVRLEQVNREHEKLLMEARWLENANTSSVLELPHPDELCQNPGATEGLCFEKSASSQDRCAAELSSRQTSSGSSVVRSVGLSTLRTVAFVEDRSRSISVKAAELYEEWSVRMKLAEALELAEKQGAAVARSELMLQRRASARNVCSVAKSMLGLDEATDALSQARFRGADVAASLARAECQANAEHAERYALAESKFHALVATTRAAVSRSEEALELLRGAQEARAAAAALRCETEEFAEVNAAARRGFGVLAGEMDSDGGQMGTRETQARRESLAANEAEEEAARAVAHSRALRQRNCAAEQRWFRAAPHAEERAAASLNSATEAEERVADLRHKLAMCDLFLQSDLADSCYEFELETFSRRSKHSECVCATAFAQVTEQEEKLERRIDKLLDCCSRACEAHCCLQL